MGQSPHSESDGLTITPSDHWPNIANHWPFPANPLSCVIDFTTLFERQNEASGQMKKRVGMMASIRARQLLQELTQQGLDTRALAHRAGLKPLNYFPKDEQIPWTRW